MYSWGHVRVQPETKMASTQILQLPHKAYITPSQIFPHSKTETILTTMWPIYKRPLKQDSVHLDILKTRLGGSCHLWPSVLLSGAWRMPPCEPACNPASECTEGCFFKITYSSGPQSPGHRLWVVWYWAARVETQVWNLGFLGFLSLFILNSFYR